MRECAYALLLIILFHVCVLRCIISFGERESRNRERVEEGERECGALNSVCLLRILVDAFDCLTVRCSYYVFFSVSSFTWCVVLLLCFEFYIFEIQFLILITSIRLGKVSLPSFRSSLCMY